MIILTPFKKLCKTRPSKLYGFCIFIFETGDNGKSGDSGESGDSPRDPETLRDI